VVGIGDDHELAVDDDGLTFTDVAGSHGNESFGCCFFARFRVKNGGTDVTYLTEQYVQLCRVGREIYASGGGASNGANQI
jgi:hypothetical protein